MSAGSSKELPRQTAAARRGGPARSPSIVALVLVTGVSPLATDVYLPKLPVMQLSLHTSAALVQATMTTFIAGFAAGQLLAGPLSDGRGRRPFVVGGSALFCLASSWCALAPPIGVLLTARAVEGLAAGAAVATGRAMLTDRFRGVEAARRFATLFVFLLLGPVVAPVLGSAVLTFTSWRGTFVLLAGLGATIAGGAVVGLPETLEHASRGLLGQLRRFGQPLVDAHFRRLLLAAAAGSAALFVYVASSSYLYQLRLGTSRGTFTLIYAATAGLMAASSLAFRGLLNRWTPQVLQIAGAALSLLAALTLTVLTFASIAPSALVTALLVVTLVGAGVVAPANVLRIQDAGRESAGTAAALNGTTSYAAGAVLAPIPGLQGPPTIFGVAALLTVLFAVQFGGLLRDARVAGRLAR